MTTYTKSREKLSMSFHPIFILLFKQRRLTRSVHKYNAIGQYEFMCVL